MVTLLPIFKKAYWALAGLGIVWALFVACLINPKLQRYALYANGLNSGWWSNPENPQEFGFAKGQVQPFRLNTSDGEQLFCWHVLPLDVYLQHEHELVFNPAAEEVADGLVGTLGEKLLSGDEEAKVVINFHGNGGHIAESERLSVYRSMSGIPHTHLLTCSYRGFGTSTLLNPPHTPTEAGLITDATSLIAYVHSTLNHPLSRTVLLGQSLGTAVTAAAALHLADPKSSLLPPDMTHPRAPHPDPTSSLAGIILVAPFTNTIQLAETMRVFGLIPVLRPLKGYPRIAAYVHARIVETWPTQPRLEALAAAAPHLRLALLHARTDPTIDFRHSEALFAPLARVVLAGEGASATEERRSIVGAERVRRGAFAYKRVESADGEKVVEMEVVRFGGHNDVLGYSAVGLAVRRAFAGR